MFSSFGAKARIPGGAGIPLFLARSVFVIYVVFASWNQPAWDLAATYVAGRLISAGQASHLYDQTQIDAVRTPHTAWWEAAEAGRIPNHVVTPYIQTPLWAWLVAPLTSAVDFNGFKRIFSAFSALSVVVAIALAASQWTPFLSGAGWQAGLLFGVCLTVPFRASFALGQTQPIFLFLSIFAAVAALRGRPVSAGIALAFATCIKVSPIFLALTWLISGRRTSLLSFAAGLFALTFLTVFLCSTSVFGNYLSTLGRLGTTVSLSYNNDSLAAVILGGYLTEARAFRFQSLPLPGWLALLSVAAASTSAVIAGLFDRGNAGNIERQTGAIFVLVAATIFTPLAWNHYFVLLIIPVMLFLHAALRTRRPIWLVPACIVFLLNVPPMAYTMGAPLAVVAYRSHFWAALVCLCALPFVNRFASTTPSAAESQPVNAANLR
jgi:hypothetical protein